MRFPDSAFAARQVCAATRKKLVLFAHNGMTFEQRQAPICIAALVLSLTAGAGPGWFTWCGLPVVRPLFGSSPCGAQQAAYNNISFTPFTEPSTSFGLQFGVPSKKLFTAFMSLHLVCLLPWTCENPPKSQVSRQQHVEVSKQTDGVDLRHSAKMHGVDLRSLSEGARDLISGLRA